MIRKFIPVDKSEPKSPKQDLPPKCCAPHAKTSVGKPVRSGAAVSGRPVCAAQNLSPERVLSPSLYYYQLISSPKLNCKVSAVATRSWPSLQGTIDLVPINTRLIFLLRLRTQASGSTTHHHGRPNNQCIIANPSRAFCQLSGLLVTKDLHT